MDFKNIFLKLTISISARTIYLVLFLMVFYNLGKKENIMNQILCFWLARIRGKKTRCPTLLFKNQHGTVLDNYHVTNSVSEGWCNHFRLIVG